VTHVSKPIPGRKTADRGLSPSRQTHLGLMLCSRHFRCDLKHQPRKQTFWPHRSASRRRPEPPTKLNPRDQNYVARSRSVVGHMHESEPGGSTDLLLCCRGHLDPPCRRPSFARHPGLAGALATIRSVASASAENGSLRPGSETGAPGAKRRPAERDPLRRGAATLGAASPTQTCLRCRTGIPSSTPRALLRADRRARRRSRSTSAHFQPRRKLSRPRGEASHPPTSIERDPNDRQTRNPARRSSARAFSSARFPWAE
jgi:hypothetical protein